MGALGLMGFQRSSVKVTCTLIIGFLLNFAAHTFTCHLRKDVERKDIDDSKYLFHAAGLRKMRFMLCSLVNVRVKIFKWLFGTVWTLGGGDYKGSIKLLLPW